MISKTHLNQRLELPPVPREQEVLGQAGIISKIEWEDVGCYLLDGALVDPFIPALQCEYADECQCRQMLDMLIFTQNI